MLTEGAGSSFNPGGSLVTGSGRPITSLVAFPKGFVAGCDGGIIRIFEKSEDPRLFFKVSAGGRATRCIAQHVRSCVSVSHT